MALSFTAANFGFLEDDVRKPRKAVFRGTNLLAKKPGSVDRGVQTNPTAFYPYGPNAFNPATGELAAPAGAAKRKNIEDGSPSPGLDLSSALGATLDGPVYRSAAEKKRVLAEQKRQAELEEARKKQQWKARRATRPELLQMAADRKSLRAV
jgi:hypothetical protein